jgi:hypothetical protein
MEYLEINIRLEKQTSEWENKCTQWETDARKFENMWMNVQEHDEKEHAALEHMTEKYENEVKDKEKWKKCFNEAGEEISE